MVEIVAAQIVLVGLAGAGVLDPARPGAASRTSVLDATGRELRSAPEIVIWLANCGTGGVPPAMLGAPVSYGVGGVGGLAAAGAVLAARAGFAGRGFPLGALTRMVGSCVPGPIGSCSEAGAFAGCPSPAVEGDGAGVVAAGVASPGCGDDCAIGEGAVWAKAPAQSDEIKKDVEASKRGRNDTEAPPPGQRNDNRSVRLPPHTATVFDRCPVFSPAHRRWDRQFPFSDGSHPRNQVCACQGLLILQEVVSSRQHVCR
jgi:hypothetical protein